MGVEKSRWRLAVEKALDASGTGLTANEMVEVAKANGAPLYCHHGPDLITYLKNRGVVEFTGSTKVVNNRRSKLWRRA